eukprot:1720717-Rhodomonas_salina.1
MMCLWEALAALHASATTRSTKSSADTPTRNQDSTSTLHHDCPGPPPPTPQRPRRHSERTWPP